VLFRRELAFPTLAKYQPYVFGLGMSAVALFLMGAGTLGVPRRHWDISFAGNPFAHEFPGAAWLMMALAGIAGLVAIVGGGMYLLITVYSVFLGKTIVTPEFKHVRAKDGVAPRPASRPVSAAITGHGSIGMGGMVAPGTFTLAMVFLVSFVLYYFINWKYLATVWPLK
jgi:cytochrome c oxidase subunit 1